MDNSAGACCTSKECGAPHEFIVVDKMLGTDVDVLSCLSNPCADGAGPRCTGNILSMGDFQEKLQWGQHGKGKNPVESYLMGFPVSS